MYIHYYPLADKHENQFVSMPFVYCTTVFQGNQTPLYMVPDSYCFEVFKLMEKQLYLQKQLAAEDQGFQDLFAIGAWDTVRGSDTSCSAYLNDH